MDSTVLKRRRKIIAASHATVHARDALGFESDLNFNDILEIILRVEDVNWGIHGVLFLRTVSIHLCLLLAT
jgi:hypothetical protein